MACDDGSLGVWDVSTAKDTWTSAGDTTPNLAITPGGELAVTTAGETLRLWKVSDIKPTLLGGDLDIWRFRKSLDNVTGTRLQRMNVKGVEIIAIDDSGRMALTGTFDGHIDRWRLADCKKDRLPLEAPLLRRHAWLGIVGLLPMHAWLGIVGLLPMHGRSGIAGISACGRHLQTWDWYGDKCHTWQAHADTIDALAPGGDDRVVSAGRDGKIKLWDLRSGRPRPLRTLHHYRIPWLEKSWLADRILRPEQLTITSAAIMADHHRFRASEGTYAERAKSDDVMPSFAREIFIARHRKLFGGVLRIAVSRDGRTLAASAYQNITLWNLPSGRRIHTIRWTNEVVTALSMAPDGARVLAASKQAEMSLRAGVSSGTSEVMKISFPGEA